jgi:hypothetical protein
MDTWSGVPTSSTPQTSCTVDDATEPTHFVKVKNLKTHNRKVFVNGIVQSSNNKARFSGPSSIVSDDRHWADSASLYGSPGTDEHTFQQVTLEKESAGQENIEVTIEYENSWDPGTRNRADRPSQPLVFRITVA